MFVFIDESGHPGDVVKRKGSFIVAACIVPGEEEINQIENAVVRIKQQYNIPENIEIKCKDMVEGHKTWRKIEPRRRIEFLNSLINELSNYSNNYGYPKFIVVIIKHKESIPSNKREILKIAYRLLTEEVISLANDLSSIYKFRYIKLIIDSIEVLQDFRIKKIIEDSIQVHFRKNILISFKDSREETCIQLSDIIAYLAKHYAQGGYTKKVGRDVVLDVRRLWTNIQNNLIAGTREF